MLMSKPLVQPVSRVNVNQPAAAATTESPAVLLFKETL